jgi:hypothetical protein
LSIERVVTRDRTIARERMLSLSHLTHDAFGKRLKLRVNCW